MAGAGSATLTERISADRAVTAVLPRVEVARVLQEEDGAAELLLHVVRGDIAGTEERHTITMDWARADLEELLRGSTSDSVVLTFDRTQLEQALGEDVEAHGLRERALVFAVAATGVLGVGGGIAHAAPSATDVSSTGGYAAVSLTDARVTDASSAGGYAAASETTAADQMTSDAASTGGYTAAAETTAADQMTSDAASTGGYTAAAETAAAGDGGFTLELPSPVDGAIAGGLALTIAAAAFTARRKKHEGIA